MEKQIVINASLPQETRIALLEEGMIVELFVERNSDKVAVGNIYKGHVHRVLPGIQAAFVDIGLEQDVFLRAEDVFTKEGLDSFFSKEFEQTAEGIPQTGVPLQAKPITELLGVGQEIMVQVVKEPLSGKGARVSGYISLPGHLIVLLPRAKHIGISRKIEDEAERERLRTIMEEEANGVGYVVRTAAEGVSSEALQKESAFYRNLWKKVQKQYASASAPALIHSELTGAFRVARDLLADRVTCIIVDDLERHEKLAQFLDELMPSLRDTLQLYKEAEPVFEALNIEGDIQRALRKKVFLRSGGYIVIEQTEALVSIDVNTGRFLGKQDHEETIFKTNIEAVREIAYQIRLRDLGGLIIIDFIDMEKKNHREKVYVALQEALLRDRSRCHVLPISELGLVQMTRKRSRQSLSQLLCEPCQNCSGEGHLPSQETICFQVYRKVLRYAQDAKDGAGLEIKVSPTIGGLLCGEQSDLIVELEKTTGLQMIVTIIGEYHVEHFEIVETWGVIK